MIALTLRSGTLNETRETATKPSNDLVRSRTSSTPRPPEPAPEQLEGAAQPAGKAEQQHDEDGAQHERPVLGEGDDLLVQQDQDQRSRTRPVERPHPAQQRHDED